MMTRTRRLLASTIIGAGLAACGGVAPEEGSTDDHLLATRIPAIPRPPVGIRLRFPILHSDRALISPVAVMAMDHDSLEGGPRTQCTNYAGSGFPNCYNNHDGTDYPLIGGLATMDRHSARVVAAAPGEVIEVVDGNYDRCEALPPTFEVTCHGHRKAHNMVVIRHATGHRTRYLHLKKNSIRVVVGDQVTCGQILGEVGSSGNSSAPHLHFELRSAGDVLVDPYSGRQSQAESFWLVQAAPDGLPGDLCPGTSSYECTVSTLTSASQCGTSLVTSASQCGTTVVVSAAQCGTTLIESATQCGTDTIESAEECGTDTVTSAVECGTDTLNSLAACILAGLSGNSCSVPRTCEVPRTCAVPRSCSVPASCTVAASCEVADTCQIEVCP